MRAVFLIFLLIAFIAMAMAAVHHHKVQKYVLRIHNRSILVVEILFLIELQVLATKFSVNFNLPPMENTSDLCQKFLYVQCQEG
ncbi:hypothetical protein NPIL_614091 [Nephila pilipes]|uniref:Secreted protein n=1 Tax=Nephila pilipes TaxID=299642 RepID=A0A8X6PKN5_NEPPI|nr:hypothetical protein NPIL_614091 [Nephila pilipes]